MKYLIALTLLISLASCKKCAECTTTVTTKVGSKPATTAEAKQELCGDELKEADGHVITSTATEGFVTVTMTSRTECN
jgi:predicted lactoylglutathione lyase